MWRLLSRPPPPEPSHTQNARVLGYLSRHACLNPAVSCDVSCFYLTLSVFTEQAKGKYYTQRSTSHTHRIVPACFWPLSCCPP